MKSNLKLSIVASASLLSVALLTGCGSDNTPAPTATSTDVSGKAVDGYLQGSTVSYGASTVLTTSDGGWNISILDSAFGNNLNKITVTGGIDSATGEAFEGTMSTVVPANSSTPSANITPLTTLVAAVVTGNDSIATVRQQIANGLGLTVTALTADPIADIDNNESKQALKAMLQVQKLVESMSKMDTNDTTISNTSFASLAEHLKTDTKDTNGSTLDDAITTTINDVVNEVFLGNEADINASKAALNIVKNQLKDINASVFTSAASLSTVSKAVEAVTSVIENSFASNDRNATLNMAKAVAITGLSKIIALVETSASGVGGDANNTSNVDASTLADSFFSADVVASSVATYTAIENLSGITADKIASIISNISKSDDDNATSAITNAIISVVEDANLSDINSSIVTLNADVATAENNVTSSVAAAGFQSFTLAGQDTNVTKTGEFAAITVSNLLSNFSVTYPTFAERVEDNTTDATFAMKITNADSQKVILKVSGVDITKNSDTNISVEADTAASLVVSYTQGSDMATLESTNLTTDTFDTNSTGAMTIDLSTKLDTIMANSTYSDFNDSINNYFTGSGVYSIQACISTNVELKDNDFYQIMTIGEDSMKCVDGNVTINY